jgi:acetyl esterase/lipase
MNGSHRQKYKENLYTCTLTPAYTQIGFKAIQTGDLPSARDPKISPIQWDRSTITRLPPVIITSGGGEALLGE